MTKWSQIPLTVPHQVLLLLLLLLLLLMMMMMLLLLLLLYTCNKEMEVELSELTK